MEVIRIREHRTVDPVLTEYLEARADADRAQRRLALATEELGYQMVSKHQKSLSHTMDGVKKTVTYVTRNNYNVDEKGLRRALTARVYDKFTIKKLDRKKLEEAMETGAVDPVVVSKYLTESASAPYIRFTEKAVDDE